MCYKHAKNVLTLWHLGFATLIALMITKPKRLIRRSIKRRLREDDFGDESSSNRERKHL
jgi:hypothetical protein